MCQWLIGNLKVKTHAKLLQFFTCGDLVFLRGGNPFQALPNQHLSVLMRCRCWMKASMITGCNQFLEM